MKASMSRMPTELMEPKRTDRRRRTHTKSRQGCRNCKLRRVKCDETKPQCANCLRYGVKCASNLSLGSDLQLIEEHTLQRSPGQASFKVTCSQPFLRPVVVVGKGLDSFVLNDECIARLSRFQSRTAYTFATAQSSELYKYDVVKMAIEHPFLMHIIQVITATHDRFLSDTKLDPKRSLTEAFHWSRGAALLNQKLSYPIRPQDRDAIWASAAMLGVANITSLEASTPAEAWPLKLADSSDLTWLYISQGKMALWDATNPLRPDSIFHFMADEYNVVMTEPSVLATEQMPTAFVSLCQLDEPLASEKNPYYSAVSILAQLLPIECSQATMKSYLQFLNNMKAPFKKLLRQKDSRALLIMAYWYGGMQQSLWWVERRARLECQAICLYLERYHGDERDIQKMLVLPRKQCGLESSNTFTDIQLINVY